MASTPRGLRLLKAIENYSNSNSNHFDAAQVFRKVKLESASNGILKGSFKVDPSMTNLGDTLHGGYISSIFDALSLFGAMSHEKGKLSWTTSAHVLFLSSANIGDTVDVEISPLVMGKSPVIESIMRHGASGALIAKGTITFLSGSDSHQKLAEDILGFKFNEN